MDDTHCVCLLCSDLYSFLRSHSKQQLECSLSFRWIKTISCIRIFLKEKKNNISVAAIKTQVGKKRTVSTDQTGPDRPTANLYLLRRHRESRCCYISPLALSQCIQAAPICMQQNISSNYKLLLSLR